MTFQAPQMLWLLLLVPAAVTLLWLREARRARQPGGYADPELLAAVVERAPAGRERLVWGLQLAALALFLIAAARPVAAPPLPTNEAATVIALDASRSMLADDVRPDRLDVARKLAEAFVSSAPRSARIGLISFSDFASLLVPPTTDHAEVLQALQKVKPSQNTSLTAAIVAGVRMLPGRKDLSPPAQLEPLSPHPSPPSPAPQTGAPGAAKRPPPGSILVLSDGAGNLSPNPRLPEDLALTAAARFASDNGVTIDAVPIGREGGAVTRIGGQDYFVPYAPQNLSHLTELSGGTLVSSPDASAMRQLSRKLGVAMRWVPRTMEVSAVLAAAAVALLLAAGALGLGIHRRLP